MLMRIILLITVSMFASLVAANPEAERIRERVKEADLEKNLKTLDNYYDAVQSRMKTGASELKNSVDGVKGKIEASVEEALEPLTSDEIKPGLNDESGIADDASDIEGIGLVRDEGLGPVRAKEMGRDPFAITREMVEGDEQLEASLDFIAVAKPTFTVPHMELKGLVRRPDGEMAALLDIQDLGIRVVRAGDTIGLQARGDEAAIRIKEVNSLQVIVETGKVGKVIVVR